MSDVDIQIDALDVFANKGFAEFRVAATFSGPFVIEKDVVIEPHGQRLLLGAAAIADFEAGKIKALRAYFDDATLLEQMLPAESRGSRQWAAPITSSSRTNPIRATFHCSRTNSPPAPRAPAAADGIFG